MNDNENESPATQGGHPAEGSALAGKKPRTQQSRKVIAARQQRQRPTRIEIKETAATYTKDYAMVVIGALLYALGYILFVTPNKFAPAGVGGILTMIQYKTGTSIGYLYLLVNIPLCLFSYFYVRRRFAVRTLVFVIVYSAAYIVMQHMPVFDAFKYQADGVLPAIAAGTMTGLVYSIVLRVDSCTGGTDIVAMCVTKKHTEFNMIWVSFAMNAVVAGISYFVYAETDAAGKTLFKFEPVLLCIIYCFVSSKVCDTLLAGSKQAVKFEVITNSAEELAHDIITELNHTATVISARGEFSHDEKTLLICVVGKRQLVAFRKILARYPGTFAYVTSVNETVGLFRKDRETMEEAIRKEQKAAEKKEKNT